MKTTTRTGRLAARFRLRNAATWVRFPPGALLIIGNSTNRPSMNGQNISTHNVAVAYRLAMAKVRVRLPLGALLIVLGLSWANLVNADLMDIVPKSANETGDVGTDRAPIPSLIPFWRQAVDADDFKQCRKSMYIEPRPIRSFGDHDPSDFVTNGMVRLERLPLNFNLRWIAIAEIV